MSVSQLLTRIVKSYPDYPAVSVGSDVLYSYSELGDRVRRLANAMRSELQLQPGDRCAIAMKNCPEFIEVMWATWYAGLCMVPVNAKLHAKEMAYILENSGSKACFASDSIANELAELRSELPELSHLLSEKSTDYQQLFDADPLDTPVSVEQQDVAWLFYTSGTTGKPKGAMLSHRSLMNMTLRYYADVDRLDIGETMLHVAPLSHASGLYSLPHIAQASNQVIPKSGGFDADETLQLLTRWPSISFFAAPTILNRLVTAAEDGQADFSNINTIFYGGAPMYFADLLKALKAIGPRMCQLYAQGEAPCTGTIVNKTMHAQALETPDLEQRLATVGIVRTGLEMRIVNDQDQDVAVGEVGEILFKSDVTMNGYWDNQEATAKTLKDGWLYTGDLGSIDEQGFLTLKDRSKDLIISGGTNIYPREVEEALLQNPGVEEVSVIGRHHPDWGEEVVAFVVVSHTGIDREALDATCLEHIARFKRPKDYYFVDSLPKNNYGKVLKTELRVIAEETSA